MSVKAVILPCRAVDIAALEHHNPSPGTESFHARRYADHASGTSTYLVAWHRRVPVARAEIQWHGCRDAAVRDAHPGCPEINGLEVFPPALRGQGLGTALITACETEAIVRGIRHIGLGVGCDNPGAQALYRRLGYAGELAYLDRYRLRDSLGNHHHIANACLFLTKQLPRHISRRPASGLLTRLRAIVTAARPTMPRHM